MATSWGDAAGSGNPLWVCALCGWSTRSKKKYDWHKKTRH